MADMSQVRGEEKERTNGARGARKDMFGFSGRSQVEGNQLVIPSSSLQAVSQCDGTIRIVSFTSTYVFSVCTNVCHLFLSSANSDEDGIGAGLDTV